MDFLDPKKRRRHAAMLILGYILIAIAILWTTILLLYVANGFRVKDGEVIQYGLLFISSAPSPANVFINGEVKERTNTRLTIAAGTYDMKVEREGYRTWQRNIAVKGGIVDRFDYALLVPNTVTTEPVQTYNAAPNLVIQSTDKRWLMVQPAGDFMSFETYDLKNPDKAPLKIVIPENVISSPASPNQAWELVEWAGDNKHVLLKHSFDGTHEFIVIDREEAASAKNINTSLNGQPTQLTLRDKKFDAYYVFNDVTKELQTASLDEPVPVTVLSNILSYKTSGQSMILYATTESAVEGKVAIKLLQGDKTYTLRMAPTGTNYLLDMARFDRNGYVTIGVGSENRVYIYRNPATQLSRSANASLVLTYALRVEAPTQLSFSPNGRFIMVENKSKFGVYDIENDKSYRYQASEPFDDPQVRAPWLDGFHLGYVSQGKFKLMDYDQANQQTIMDAQPRYGAFLAPNAETLFAFDTDPANPAQLHLTSTSLRTAEDQ